MVVLGRSLTQLYCKYKKDKIKRNSMAFLFLINILKDILHYVKINCYCYY